MLPFNRQRYSCRAYNRTPIAAEHAALLQACMGSITRGPLGAPLRLTWAATTDQDRHALRCLGTGNAIATQQ